MKSEWRVSNNPVMEPTPYNVYRIRNTDEVDHSGNREYAGRFFKDKESAQIYANHLNEVEAQNETGGKE